jgi:hypothetical protein
VNFKLIGTVCQMLIENCIEIVRNPALGKNFKEIAEY